MAGERDPNVGRKIVRPLFSAVSLPAEEELSPYEISAVGLDNAIVQAQLSRLNEADRFRARRHLGLVTESKPSTKDEAESTEKAMAKMRHPSVARVWRLRPTLVTNPDQSPG